MPAFGRPMLEQWSLDPAITYLNHGTVGAPPRRVLAHQAALRQEMELQPSRFVLRELATRLAGSPGAPWREQPRLREAIAGVAPFLGVKAADLVFVPNVTAGLNAVLQALPLADGDEVVMTDLAYGAIAMAADFAARRRGAKVTTVATPFPLRRAEQVTEAVLAAITPRTRLLVVDHVAAGTALVLPVAEIAAECHRRGVDVLVDGAHAPGSIALDIASLGVDWYAANLHKWAHAPRSCGILWAAPDRQAGLHPPVISWGHGLSFIEEFEMTATGDPTAYLAAPEGIALLEEWGFAGVLAYIHELAWEGALWLTGYWGTELTTPRAMAGAMVTVALPERAGSSAEDAAALRLALLVEDGIEVQLHERRGRLWARVSAQVYNDMADMERLAQAVLRRLP